MALLPQLPYLFQLFLSDHKSLVRVHSRSAVVFHPNNPAAADARSRRCAVLLTGSGSVDLATNSAALTVACANAVLVP
jgi:hypothetical protein